MADKSQVKKKDTKKEPTYKNIKEKRAAKAAKKEGKQQSLRTRHCDLSVGKRGNLLRHG